MPVAGQGNAGSVYIDVLPNMTRFQTELDAALRQAASRNVNVNIGANTGRATTQINALQSRLERLSSGDYTARVSVNLNQATLRRIQEQISGAIGDGVRDGGRRARPEADRSGEQVGGAFARSFRTRLDAALRALPPVNIDANSTPAQRAIADLRTQIAALRNANIGVDLDAGTALARINGLSAQLGLLGANTVDIGVRVDTAAAQASLEAFRAEVNRISPEITPRVNGGAFATQLRAQLDAALRALPEIRLDADTTPAERTIARLRGELEALQSARVGVDLDAGEAQARIRELSAELSDLAARSPDIRVRVDAARAAAELAALRAEANSTDRDLNRLGGGSSASAFAGLSSSINILHSPLASLPSLIGPAIGALVLLAANAAVASGSLVALGPALAGLGGAALTVGLAFKGVGGALKAYSADQKKADTAGSSGASTALSNAIAIRSAEQSIADARRQQARVFQDTAITVQRAEQQVVDAVEAEARAQQAVTVARAEAQRQIEDLNARVADLAISQEEATLAVQQAQLELTQTMNNAASTDLQRAEAQVALQRAQQNLTDTNRDLTRSTQDATAANAKGVDGSSLVVSAQDQAAQAADRTAQAQQDLAIAQRDAGRAQEDAARAVANALQNLRDVHAQQAAASTASAASADTFGAAMARLSPAAQAFVNQLISMRPLLDQLKTTAAESFLPGLTAGIQAALPVFPALNNAIGQMGLVLGDTFRQLGAFVGSPFFSQALTNVSTQNAIAFRNLGDAAVPLWDGITRIAQAAEPLVVRFSEAFKQGSQLFDQWVKGKESTGQLASFFKQAGDQMARWWDTFKSVAGLAGELIRVLSPIGGVLLDTIKGLADSLKPLIAPIADLIGQVGGQLASVLIPVLKPLIGFIGQILEKLQGPLKQIFAALTPVIGVLAQAFGKILEAVLPIVPPLANLIAHLVTGLAPILTPIIDMLGKVIAQVGQQLVAALIQAMPAISQIILALAQLLPAVLPLIPAVAQMETAFLPLVPLIAQLVAVILTSLMPIIQPLLAAFIAVAVFMTDVMALAIRLVVDVLVQLGNAVIWVWQAAFTPALAGIGWLLNLFYTAVILPVGSAVTTAVHAVGDAAVWLWHNAFEPAINGIATAWSWLWNNGIRPQIDAIKKAFSDLTVGADAVWRAITAAFDKVKGTMMLPVNFVIDNIYNHGIAAVWNDIVGAVGLGSLKLPHIDPIRLATGGVVPGKGNRDTVPALLTPGERVLSLSQVRMLGGHSVIDELVGRGRQGGRGGAYGLGGIVSAITGTVTHWARGALAEGAKAALAPVRALVNTMPVGDNPLGQTLKKMPGTAMDKLIDWLRDDDKKNLPKAAAGVGGSVPGLVGGGVSRWAPVAAQALALLGQPASLVPAVLTRISIESGGDPGSINRYDINWQHGTPSVGLVQVIGPTFARWANQFRNTPPLVYGVSEDPLANIYAGMNYAMHRYGSGWIKKITSPGGYDSGGWLQPGMSLVENRTGRPEAVLNPQQWQHVETLATNPTQGATINNYWPPQITADEAMAMAWARLELLNN